MKTLSSVVLMSLMLCVTAFAQAPAAASPAAAGTPGSRVAVIDFNRAVIECSEGKKATELIQAEMKKLQTAFEKAQGEMEALQKQAQTQNAALSDAAKADLSKKIDAKNT